MHGDIMKKKINIQYKSIFKYEDHHETVQYKARGTYEKDNHKTKISFYQDDTKIEITIRQDDVLLTHGRSMLNLSYHRKIMNHYYTEYGMIELQTELLTLEYDKQIKLKYILYDNGHKISDVYVLVNYQMME